MWHRDTNWADDVGKMAPKDFLHAGSPETFNLWRKKHIHTQYLLNAIKWCKIFPYYDCTVGAEGSYWPVQTAAHMKCWRLRIKTLDSEAPAFNCTLYPWVLFSLVRTSGGLAVFLCNWGGFGTGIHFHSFFPWGFQRWLSNAEYCATCWDSISDPILPLQGVIGEWAWSEGGLLPCFFRALKCPGHLEPMQGKGKGRRGRASSRSRQWFTWRWLSEMSFSLQGWCSCLQKWGHHYFR